MAFLQRSDSIPGSRSRILGSRALLACLVYLLTSRFFFLFYFYSAYHFVHSSFDSFPFLVSCSIDDDNNLPPEVVLFFTLNLFLSVVSGNPELSYPTSSNSFFPVLKNEMESTAMK